MSEPKTTKKQWDKINIEPGYLRVIKRIAIDENLYVYQLVREVFEEKYPEYFRKYGC
jgi:hypothetical protein